jgi:hypothetical protein
LFPAQGGKFGIASSLFPKNWLQFVASKLVTAIFMQQKKNSFISALVSKIYMGEHYYSQSPFESPAVKFLAKELAIRAYSTLPGTKKFRDENSDVSKVAGFVQFKASKACGSCYYCLWVFLHKSIRNVGTLAIIKIFQIPAYSI